MTRLDSSLWEKAQKKAREGIEKIATGSANHTGDASWGTFGVAFAPGEAPLEPGKTYAIEIETVENFETLHGFVNIKGQVSDERRGDVDGAQLLQERSRLAEPHGRPEPAGVQVCQQAQQAGLGAAHLRDVIQEQDVRFLNGRHER